VGQSSNRASSGKGQNRRGSAYLWIAVALVWTVWILVVGTEKNPRTNWLTKLFGDKALHAGSFVVGGLLWIHSIRQLTRRGIAFSVGWGSIIPLAFGVILELVQRSVPGRKADPNDLAADLGGTLVAVVLYLFAVFVSTRKSASQSVVKERIEP
jgi:VanZ family protein